jgi:hypothetical protein
LPDTSTATDGIIVNGDTGGVFIVGKITLGKEAPAPFRVWAKASPIVPAKAAAVAKETAHTRVRVAVENIINFPVEESCTIGES